MGSWLPGKEKSALLVVSVAADMTGKGGLMEELKTSPTSWGQSPHFVQRGQAGRQALPLRAAWTPCAAEAEHRYFTRKPALSPLAPGACFWRIKSLRQEGRTWLAGLD